MDKIAKITKGILIAVTVVLSLTFIIKDAQRHRLPKSEDVVIQQIVSDQEKTEIVTEELPYKENRIIIIDGEPDIGKA